MYSLDVNFLRERKEQPAPRKKPLTQEQAVDSGVSAEDKLPLIIGAIVLVALPAAVSGYWWFTSQQIQELEGQVSNLEQELSQAEGDAEQVTQKQQELEQAEENLTALADIFNTIKPMSAVLQDVRDRAPSNLQINSLQESGEDTFSVEGIGESFEAVNYFFLTLQRSPLIERESVNLETASQSEIDIELAEELPEDVEEVSTTPVISYTISFQLNDDSASNLLDTLEEKGAMGLVTRIRTLQDRGIVQ